MNEHILIYRLIGNSLPPRHGIRHAVEALSFILSNEPDLPQAEKRWVLNRIADPAVEVECIRLIEGAGKKYLRIPFDPERYRCAFLDASGMPDVLNPFAASETRPARGNEEVWAKEWMLRHKSLAAIDLNYARNFALEQGKTEAQWILPLDGSCFFTSRGWEEVRAALAKASRERYAVIPLARIADNTLLLDEGFAPREFEEPQMAFRNDTKDRFDERLRYGNMNKAELLARLCVPGPWTNWNRAPWEHDELPKAHDPGNFIRCGWVARLSPGADESVEAQKSNRWKSRFEGVKQFTRALDKNIVEQEYLRGGACCYRIEGLGASGGSTLEMGRLTAYVDQLCNQRVSTILDKTNLPPSSDKQDYFSPAPYDHSDAARLILKDGKRRPDAVIGSAESRVYDRTALDESLRSLTVLSLAGMLAKNDRYLRQAVVIIDTWFINPKTRMNPHLKYAQWLPQSPQSVNFAGLVDFRDIWVVPGILNALNKDERISDEMLEAVKSWFATFLDYLLKSTQGRAAYSRPNNIGTWTHLILSSAAAFVGRFDLAADLLNTATLRLSAQCGPLGMQKHELGRANPLHYSLFNLSAWTALASLGRSLGVDLWQYRGVGGASICRMAAFIASNKPLFEEYGPARDVYDSWFGALVSVVPEDAQDRRLLPIPDSNPQSPWFDDPNFGLPPLWPALAPRAKQS